MPSSKQANLKSATMNAQEPSTSRLRTEEDDPLKMHMFVFHGHVKELAQHLANASETLDINHKDFHGECNGHV